MNENDKEHVTKHAVYGIPQHQITHTHTDIYIYIYICIYQNVLCWDPAWTCLTSDRGTTWPFLPRSDTWQRPEDGGATAGVGTLQLNHHLAQAGSFACHYQVTTWSTVPLEHRDEKMWQANETPPETMTYNDIQWHTMTYNHNMPWTSMNSEHAKILML